MSVVLVFSVANVKTSHSIKIVLQLFLVLFVFHIKFLWLFIIIVIYEKFHRWNAQSNNNMIHFQTYCDQSNVNVHFVPVPPVQLTTIWMITRKYKTELKLEKKNKRKRSTKLLIIKRIIIIFTEKPASHLTHMNME